MDQSAILSNLFDDKTVAILKCLLTKKDIFYLRDLSRESGVSLATTYRITQKLKDLGLVIKNKKEKFTYYELIRNTPLFEQVYSIIAGSRPDPIKLLESRLREAKAEFELQKKEDKLIIISSQNNNELINKLIIEIEMETGIRLKYIIITPEQLTQMKNIGLLS